MNKYLVEFIGTFFLMLTIGMVVIEPGASAVAPLAIGSVLMVLVYAGGHVSGAHYNPAITVAFWLRGTFPAREIIPYIIAQVFAAAAAAFLLPVLKASPQAVAVVPLAVPGFAAEFIFTFLLAFVIMNVATSAQTAGNQYFGLAIGFTVLAGAFAVGPVSGAVFNPAVVVGGTLMGIFPAGSMPLYFGATFLGAAAGTGVFRLVDQTRP